MEVEQVTKKTRASRLGLFHQRGHLFSFIGFGSVCVSIFLSYFGLLFFLFFGAFFVLKAIFRNRRLALSEIDDHRL